MRSRRALPAASEWIELARPVPSLMTGAEVILGASITAPLSTNSVDVLVSALSTTLATAASNTYNDARDYKSDVHLRPCRPIPSGRVSLRYARIICGLYAAAAIALQVLIGPGQLTAVAVLLAMGFAYSIWFKPTVLAGNLLVSLLAGCPVLLGSWIMGGPTKAALFGFVLVSLYMLAFEILKTIRDTEGDSQASFGTLSVTLGVKRSFFVFWLAGICFVLTSLLVGLSDVGGISYGLVMLIGVVAPCVTRAWIAGTSFDGIPISLRLMSIAWLPGALAIGLLR